MTLAGNWNYPTTIRFGAGRISELPILCAELGMHRPLLVTDAGLAALPPVQKLVEVLAAAGIAHALFHELHPNPALRDVDAGVAALKAGAHDGVIAIGGGSALDVGKTVALMAGQTRPLWDFEDVGDNWKRVDTAAMLPVIAIPTTAGTGSEVGRAALIIDEAAQRKVIIFHPAMLPSRVLADPELTTGLPPRLTAATGIDALVHNFEAYCAPGYHPMADGIALEGMRLVHGFLLRAVRDGSDIEARSQMLAASMMGATAFQKGLGAVHALAHPIGAVFDIHHGLANAILLPYVMQRNRPAIEDKMLHLARILDLPGSGYDAVLQWVLTLRREAGIPHSLGDIGLNEARAGEIGSMAKADPSDGGNPCPLTPGDYSALFRHAIAGRLHD
ncbi:iron-containing alcohol dehydrogenase [Craterilacuibacter sinensis]|uniref:Iron-containing alcohol dehydrogenase n=1 Tax=Craterilacuibacter sinensis TaxID=2686017 RepID=A0A845BP15_9NEIS|nr:iron-containing alcohol dehydrogenase [Craterilacuibacter sinensis]MXR36994.1 iron-containing alcohol dehydrogenase [Craterilacuibacter sinensis]